MAVVVVTDSSACLPAELLAALDIRVVPLHVLESAPGVTTTSAPSPAELGAEYQRARSDSDGAGVLAVHISRHLSRTWEAACVAASDGVRVVDSLGAGLGTGFVALAAARRAAAGASLDEVNDAAVDVAARARSHIVVDRLEQLRRGGRISTAAVIFGTALVTRPLLELVDGKLTLADKARTASKVFDKMADAVVREAGDVPVALAVQHVDAPDRANALVDNLRARVPAISELITAPFDPALAVHLGSGAVGAVVIPGGLA